MKTNRKNILSKMFASFAQDAEPEELEQAAGVLQDMAEEPAVEPEKPEAASAATDDGIDTATVMAKLNELIDLLKASNTAPATTDEDPAMPEELEKTVPDADTEEDPLEKLQADLDEIKKTEEEEVVAPDEDPAEPEAHFVDPEELNEQEDADPEEEEEPMPDKKSCDSARIALNAIKPVIAALPPYQRKKAADAAVKAIRTQTGLDAKPIKNGYLAIRKSKVKKAADSSKVTDLGEKIMASRNCNYKK